MINKQERDMLKKANPDKNWAKKVDEMSNEQVAAVLERLRRQNKI